jgi:hypothetical protein
MDCAGHQELRDRSANAGVVISAGKLKPLLISVSMPVLGLEESGFVLHGQV